MLTERGPECTRFEGRTIRRCGREPANSMATGYHPAGRRHGRLRARHGAPVSKTAAAGPRSVRVGPGRRGPPGPEPPGPLLGQGRSGASRPDQRIDLPGDRVADLPDPELRE